MSVESPSFSMHPFQQLQQCQNCNYNISNQAGHHSCLIQIRADLNRVLQEINAVKQQQQQTSQGADCLKEIQTLKVSLEKQGKVIKELEKYIDSKHTIIFERVKESEKEFKEKFEDFLGQIEEKMLRLENMQMSQNFNGGGVADTDLRNITFSESSDVQRIGEELLKNNLLLLQEPIHNHAHDLSFSKENQLFKEPQIPIIEEFKVNKEEFSISESQRNQTVPLKQKVAMYLLDYDLDVKNANTDKNIIVPKLFDFMTEYIEGNQYEYSQKYSLIEVSAGKIQKSQKMIMKERKEWIRNSIIEHDSFGSLYLSNTSNLNGFFVIAKKDLIKMEERLKINELSHHITIQEVSVTKTIDDLRAMLENRWVNYMNTLPKDKYEFVIDQDV